METERAVSVVLMDVAFMMIMSMFVILGVSFLGKLKGVWYTTIWCSFKNIIKFSALKLLFFS